MRKVTTTQLPELTEAQVARQCRDALELAGWRVHRLTADRYPGRWHKSHERVDAGTPDYVCVRDYHAIYLEVKRPGGKLRDSQWRWIGNARMSGSIVIVADSLESLIECKEFWG